MKPFYTDNTFRVVRPILGSIRDFCHLNNLLPVMRDGIIMFYFHRNVIEVTVRISVLRLIFPVSGFESKIPVVTLYPELQLLEMSGLTLHVILSSRVCDRNRFTVLDIVHI